MSILKRLEVFCLELIEARSDLIVPQARRAITIEQLIVACKRESARQFFLLRQSPVSCRHDAGNLGAQRNDVSVCAGMDRIRKDNHVGVRKGIDPNGSSCETRVAKRSHREELPTVRRKSGIDIPTEPANS